MSESLKISFEASSVTITPKILCNEWTTNSWTSIMETDGLVYS